MMTEITIDQTIQYESPGFHGPRTITIEGRNWRAHNHLYLSCDAPYPEETACETQDCVCGGYYGPELDPAIDSDRLLVSTSWIDRDAYPALDPLIDQTEVWLAEETAKINA